MSTNGQIQKSFMAIVWFAIAFLTLGSYESAAKNRPDSGCANPPSGMIGWWAGDGNPNDIQGGHNGIVHGNPLPYAVGMVGQAFVFNGIDDFVSLPEIPAMNFGTGDFTIDFWERSSNSSRRMNAVSLLPNYPLSNLVFDFNDPDNTPSPGLWVYWNSSGGNAIITGAAGQFTNGEWHHIALTRNGTILILYVDGVAAGSAAYSEPINLSSVSNYIGGGNGSAMWDGLLDEVEIFNRGLSPTEIQAIYNAGSAGKCRQCSAAAVGLTSWWQADGNGLDSRGRADGSLSGALFAAGLKNQAFDLDGIDDAFIVPHNDNQNISGSFSAEAWIYPRTFTNTFPYILNKFNGTNRWLMAVTNSPPYQNSLHVNIDDNSFFTPNNSIALGRWSHIAFTYNAVNGTIKLFVNGIPLTVTTAATHLTTSGSSAFYIGNEAGNGRQFDGLIDEVKIYNRELTETEIQAVVNAGNAGNCSPTATVSPAGLVGWWGGDGNANDYVGTNNGSLQNGAGFTIGKVGQSFSFDGINDYLAVPDSPSLNPSTELTIEAWVYPVSDSAGLSDFSIILNKETEAVSPQFEIGRKNDTGCVFGGPMPTGNLAFGISGLSGLPADCNGWTDGNAYLPLNIWSHVSLTYDGANVRVYLNGAITRTIPATGTILPSTGELRIGTRTVGVTGNPVWQGLLDEVSIYNRALAQTEIQSIYNAGLAGKLKLAATPADVFARQGRNISKVKTPLSEMQLGDATIILPTVSAAGETQQIPLDLAKFPPLPMGYTPAGPTYDIATSAVWSGTPTVCFNVPSLSAQFANLRILHLESGVWVPRTALGGSNPMLCSSGLTTLSPFAIVKVAPSAANALISGRVLTARGTGIRNVLIQVTGPGGVIKNARTNTFGYYKFEDLEVGQTYVLVVWAKKYSFSESTRLIVLNEDLTDADFVAQGLE
ncbi:MAG: carboxypeptidase regulatory-like domain-containing protein [Acidobacteria bacterium]|nr:carboxypeptidase regulatory-like domain-containing protein [Acidobacteriota bacterium]